MADTRKGLLQQQFDALLAGASNAASNAASGAYKAAVPVNARQFVKGLMGDTSGVSEDDLWPSDKAELQKVVAHAMAPGGQSLLGYHQDNTPNAGIVDYSDYKAPSSAFFVGDGNHRHDSSLWNIIKASYTDPAFRMATTVGGATYKRQPDGTVALNDTYNFDYPNVTVPAGQTKRQYLIDMLKRGAPADTVLEKAGNMFIGNDATGYHGKPYSINLGNIK